MTSDIADGVYNWKFRDKEPGITTVMHGRIANGHGPSVEFCLEHGDTFEPVVILTVTEHNELTRTIAELRQQLEAQAGWETVEDGEYHFPDGMEMQVDEKMLFIANGYMVSSIWFGDNLRLQRRKAQGDE